MIPIIIFWPVTEKESAEAKEVWTASLIIYVFLVPASICLSAVLGFTVLGSMCFFGLVLFVVPAFFTWHYRRWLDRELGRAYLLQREYEERKSGK